MQEKGPTLPESKRASSQAFCKGRCRSGQGARISTGPRQQLCAEPVHRCIPAEVSMDPTASLHPQGVHVAAYHSRLGGSRAHDGGKSNLPAVQCDHAGAWYHTRFPAGNA
ncbi:unnamed protein product [Ectocarpus sp. 8 AP-2014]